MRVLLVGARGSRKDLTYSALTVDYPDWTYHHNMPPGGVGDPLGPATDKFADYRTELLIATHRAHEQDHSEVDIYFYSLIDSLAFTTARLSNIITDDALPDDEQERWVVTEIVMTYLVRDSLSYDLVFFFPGSTQTAFDTQIAALFPQIMEILDIPFVTLEGDVTENALGIASMVNDGISATQ